MNGNINIVSLNSVYNNDNVLMWSVNISVVRHTDLSYTTIRRTKQDVTPIACMADNSQLDRARMITTFQTIL